MRSTLRIVFFIFIIFLFSALFNCGKSMEIPLLLQGKSFNYIPLENGQALGKDSFKISFTYNNIFFTTSNNLNGVDIQLTELLSGLANIQKVIQKENPIRIRYQEAKLIETVINNDEKNSQYSITLYMNDFLVYGVKSSVGIKLFFDYRSIASNQVFFKLLKGVDANDKKVTEAQINTYVGERGQGYSFEQAL